jgi:hypothetical protein
MAAEPPDEKPVIDEPPPFLGSWQRVYVMVVCYLGALIALFYVFTRRFAP